MKRTITAGVLAFALAGCGGGGGGADDTAEEAKTGNAPTTAATASPEAKAEESAPTSGAEVVAALKAAGLPVTLTVDYDETTDPNKQLGRPGGYLDKVAFTDSRIKAADVADSEEGSVELGGGVEVFATEAEAQARADYIKEVTAGMPALTEYGYVKGGALLRLSRQLTPAQAAEYEAAL